MIQYFKTPVQRRRSSRIMWIVGALAILLLLLFFIARAVIHTMSADLTGGDAAQR